MASRRLVGVVAAVCALLLSACSDGNGTPSNTPTGDGSGVVGSGTASGGPTTTPPPAALPSSAEQYTRNAIDAWTARDVAQLDRYESSDGVLHTMLDCDGCYNTAFTLAPDFCQGAAGSSYCLYVNLYGDKLLLRVDNQLLGQTRAMGTGSTFEPTTFPAANEAYATQALQAWIDGNDNRLKLLTRQQITSAQIDAMGAERGPGWTFDSCQGAAGSTYCGFTRGGHTIAFQFSNEVQNPPTTGPDSQHRIVQVSYLG